MIYERVTTVGPAVAGKCARGRLGGTRILAYYTYTYIQTCKVIIYTRVSSHYFFFFFWKLKYLHIIRLRAVYPCETPPPPMLPSRNYIMDTYRGRGTRKIRPRYPQYDNCYRTGSLEKSIETDGRPERVFKRAPQIYRR